MTVSAFVRFRALHAFVPACIGLATSTAVNAQDRTVSVEATYVGDLWSAVDGGLSDSAVYIQQLDVGVTIDLERVIAGWEGATLYVQGSYNDGSEFSALAGDAQIVSNIEAGVTAVRLYEAWLQQELDERSSIKVGLIDLNTEFDVLDHAGLFINSAHGVGSVLGLSGENGPSIFPATSLAARVDYEFDSGLTLRLGVFDGVPGDLDRPNATAIKLGHGEGVLVATEAELPLPAGKLLFGHWRYTADFETIDGFAANNNRGWYVRGEHWLTPPAQDEKAGLAGFFRIGTGEGSINPFDTFLGAGLTYYGPLEGRPEDRLGLALATVFASDVFERISGARGAETNIELTYSAQLTDWLRLQPEIQYVSNPAADPATGNALALGLRVELHRSY